MVNILRNWARAKAKKADSKGTFDGTMDGSDDADRVPEFSPPAAIRTRTINNPEPIPQSNLKLETEKSNKREEKILN